MIVGRPEWNIDVGLEGDEVMDATEAVDVLEDDVDIGATAYRLARIHLYLSYEHTIWLYHD